MAKSVMLQTLLDLLNIQSYSGEEQKVVEYVIPLLNEYGFEVKIDELLNIYATRGESDAYPLLNAHMDAVKGYSYSYSTNKKRPVRGKCTECIYSDIEGSGINCITCHRDVGKVHTKVSMYQGYSCEHFNPGTPDDEVEVEVLAPKKTKVATYSDKTKVISGDGSRPIGGDDKCGMAIALEIARTTDIPMKIVFTVQEEIGCVGSTYAVKYHSDWFEDCAYGITIDRKDNNHICVTTGGSRNANNFFIGELAKWGIISGVGVKLERGTSSDNRVFRELVSNFVNISAGYHAPHTTRETVQYDAVKRIKNWVKNFITKGEFKSEQET